ncbi:AfsR/SARP family transcriptional regulator [Protofrankia symbiont of Coriaria ruscifolia]|uniref:AfsR/SARP family transcriptional regulator n=1 Tax=Protofrankia symbiont of Coriaria ruscifolia TaxID=1306542 RepID=UPI0010417D40|nr:bacterial transcriptional activator domain-containing protein [Protofrankia symbiont of Coriaria ruscifolia]
MTSPALHLDDPTDATADRFGEGIPRLYLLGGFRLVVDGRTEPLGIGSRRLLALLALRKAPVPRITAAQLLWSDCAGERALTELRGALYRLGPSRAALIDAAPRELLLSGSIRVDVREAWQTCTAVLGSSADASDRALRAALACNLDDDLLPDWDDEWLRVFQDQWRQRRLHALEALSARLTAARWHGAAVDAALAAVHADPYRVSAHQALTRAFTAEGNRHEALRHIVTYWDVLCRELGLDLSDDPVASLGAADREGRASGGDGIIL